jgi:hypothetical protein
MIILLQDSLVFCFVAWFVLSVCNQFNWRRLRSLRYGDKFRLLPIWTFFAPNPGMTDYHLVVRNVGHDGTPYAWVEHCPPEIRPAWTSVYNPTKRYRKCITDCTQSMLTLSSFRDEQTTLQLSVPYLAMLNLVCGLGSTKRAHSCQFAIVQTTGFAADDPSVIFRSAVHKL